MEDGYMLWQDPVTGLYEQKKIEPEVIEEWEEEVDEKPVIVKTVIKQPVKVAEKKK